MKINIGRRWARLLLFAVGVLILAGCDSGGLAPDRVLKRGVAVSGAEDEVAAVATHREGEWLAAYSREGSEYVSEVVYSTADGDRAFVKLDGEGRPLLAVAGPHVLAFGRYDGPRADVGLVNTESGRIETFDQVDLRTDFGSNEPAGSDSTANSPAQATETAGHGIAALVCSMAAISALDSPLLEDACQKSALLQVATGATEQTDWEETTELIGWGSKINECGDNYGPSCLEALIGASGTVVEETQAQIDDSEQEVAQASVVVRFGGTWSYQDLDQSFFVIEEDLSYDISYSNFGDCYFINRLEPLGLNKNQFRYRVDSGEDIVTLKFDRVGAEVLTVTRLSDGKKFEWVLSTAQDLQTFLDDECGSSSSTAPPRTPSIPF